MTTVPVVRVRDDSTADDLREALTHLNHRAKREFHVVGTADMPTPWDERHRAIDDLLHRLLDD